MRVADYPISRSGPSRVTTIDEASGWVFYPLWVKYKRSVLLKPLHAKELYSEEVYDFGLTATFPRDTLGERLLGFKVLDDVINEEKELLARVVVEAFNVLDPFEHFLVKVCGLSFPHKIIN